MTPSMTVAPMPTTTQSWMVAPWMMAPCPMVTLLPIRVGSFCRGRGGAGQGSSSAGHGRQNAEVRWAADEEQARRCPCPGCRQHHGNHSGSPPPQFPRAPHLPGGVVPRDVHDGIVLDAALLPHHHAVDVACRGRGGQGGQGARAVVVGARS